jgi:hypothetical protein
MASQKEPGNVSTYGPDGKSKTWLMGTSAFERRMPHHDGIKALWETKWKFPVSF